MPPSTITVRFARWWWLGLGTISHAVPAVASGILMYQDGVPIWFFGPVLFGVVGVINMVLAATGVYPYLRLTPRRVSYRSIVNGHTNHVDLGPGDTVTATAEGLYHRPWGSQWERLGASRALADSKDWHNLQYWTGGLEPQQEQAEAARAEPAIPSSVQTPPQAAQPQAPTSAVVAKRQKRQRNVY